MQPITIARIEPQGPKGKLERRESRFPAEWMATDQPVIHGHRYLDDIAGGVWVSVWEATPFTMAPHPLSMSEFMLVLEGSVTIVETGGRETTIRAGESFVVPQGLHCYWKQTEFFRKFSFGFRNASWREPANIASLHVIKVDPNGGREESSSPPARLLLGPTPSQYSRESFTDLTGQFSVGVWETTAYHRKSMTSARHEWMHVVDGLVTLTDAEGTVHRFVTGDTFLVPLGTLCDWRCDGYLRTIYCRFQPKVIEAKTQARPV